MSRELRPHQVAIMDRLRESLSTGHRRPMLQASDAGRMTAGVEFTSGGEPGVKLVKKQLS